MTKSVVRLRDERHTTQTPHIELLYEIYGRTDGCGAD